MRQADKFKEGIDPGLALFFWHAFEFESKNGIGTYGAPRQEGWILKDEGHGLARVSGSHAVDKNVAGGSGRKAGDKLEHCGFAAARRSDDAEKFAFRHGEVKVVDDQTLVFLRHTGKFDLRNGEVLHRPGLRAHAISSRSGRCKAEGRPAS